MRVRAILLTAILLISSLAVVIPVSAATIWTVDDDGVEYPDPDYSTIQEAIDNASSGDTILVYPGTYPGDIEVKIEYPNIHLISYEFEFNGTVTKDTTLIDATTSVDGVKIENGSVTFKGFTITGADTNASIGLKIETSMGVNISHNIITGFYYGIKVETAEEVLISHNTITDNDYGIYVDIDEPTDIIANLNDIYGNRLSGIRNEGGAFDAQMNWWGTGIQSDIEAMFSSVSGSVDVNPWLPADFETSLSDLDGDGFMYYEEVSLGTDPNEPLDCPGASIENYQLKDVMVGGGTLNATEDTGITVDYEANEETRITVATYEENPEDDPSFSALDNYIDVRVDEPENLDSILIKIDYTDPDLGLEPSLINGIYEDNLRVYYWDGLDWAQCSDIGVDMAGNYMWAVLDYTTTPDLSYLSGGEFGPGEIYMELDKEFYKTGDTVNIRIEDTTEDGIIGVVARSDIDFLGAIIAMFETGVDTGIFTGTFKFVGDNPVTGEIFATHGDIITVDKNGAFITATVDDKSPKITSIDIESEIISDIEFVTGTTVIISADIIEANIWNASIRVDGLEIDSVTGDGDGTVTIEWDTTTYLDGTHEISVSVKDGAGNTDLYSVSVEVDNTNPMVTNPMSSHSIIGLGITSEIILTATVEETGIGIDTVTVDCSDIDGDSNVPMTDLDEDGMFTSDLLIVIGVVEDVYELTITAIDSFGNENADDFITLQVMDVVEGPSDVTFTEVETISGGLIIKGLTGEDPLIDIKEYTILVDENELTTITEASLTSTTWTDNSFNRIAVLDLSDYLGETIEVTVVASNIALQDSDPIILYEGLIPECAWYPLLLEKGWNLISLPLVPTSSAREDILSLILDQGESGVIITYEYDQYNDGWITNPAEITDGCGYWLYMLDDDVMIVEGIETQKFAPSTYEFTSGWVLGGYKATTTGTTYFGSLESDTYFPSIYFWDAPNQNWKSSEIENDRTVATLELGQGFWIYMYDDQYLIPPIP